MKNIVDKIEALQVKISNRYSLKCAEAFELKNLARGPLEAIAMSFQYGYSQGMKAAGAEKAGKGVIK